MEYSLEEIKAKVFQKFMDSNNLEKYERFSHTISVMEMAETLFLSNKLKIDLNKVKVAALVHDYAKFCNQEELLSYANKYSLILNDADKNSKVLHALVGPLVIKEEITITDKEILDAVKFHTTGNQALDSLSMLIYVADFVEEGRTFAEAKLFRNIAMNDLFLAGAKIAEFTIQKLKEQKKIIHPNTLKMYEYYKKLI